MIFGSLWRHKTRSSLTGLGIVIAIAAIVSLGSISEGISTLVDQQFKLASEFVFVVESGGFDFGSSANGLESKIDLDIVEDIEAIDGVEDVIPQIRAMTADYVFVIGLPIEDLEFFGLENIEFKEGGWPQEGDKEIVLGHLISENKDLRVSDEIKVEDEYYVVSGTLEETGGTFDYGTITSFEAASDTFGFEDEVTALIVRPTDIDESKRIANEIEDLYDDLDAIAGEEAIQRAQDAIGQIRVITLSIGIVASIVASIGIINTMVMMVFERRNEFGIMKALGAKKQTILLLVMQESIILGIIGSIIGISFGAFGTYAINQTSGYPIASVTPSLVFFSMIYGILLSVLAAAYPAYQAISVNPVDAMRER